VRVAGRGSRGAAFRGGVEASLLRVVPEILAAGPEVAGTAGRGAGLLVNEPIKASRSFHSPVSKGKSLGSDNVCYVN
jgi:hypothetical protein